MVGVTEEDAKDPVRLLILLCYALLGKGNFLLGRQLLNRRLFTSLRQI